MDVIDTDDSLIHGNDEENIFINENGVFMRYTQIENIFPLNLQRNVCKLELKIDGNLRFATGFFCYIPSKEVIVLITNYHVIDNNYLSKNKEIKYIIEDNGQEEERVISLRLKRNKIVNKELDVTIIEMLDEDNIENFFEVDEDFIKNKNLKDEKIFSIHYPKGQDLNISFGKVIDCYDNSIEYDIGTAVGSSGSPLISVDGNKVIGLHKGGYYTKKKKEKIKNIGTILDKIIKLIPQSYSLKHNIIKCTYYIKKEDLNKDIKVYHNSNNISEKINDITIQRQGENGEILGKGMYRFNKEGKYFFKYKFDDSLNDLSRMFYDCTSLTGVFIPSFPENKITDLSSIFEGCHALKNIHFYFNTKDVKDMSGMFKNCQSLEYINLSSFDTKNVIDMSSMFEYCFNLQLVDLSSFNTKFVKDMSFMFNRCKKLKDIDLSSFNTEKVKNMSYMFYECEALEKLNLSNFKICNVNNMKDMFGYCSSLKVINLTSSQTNEIVDLTNMFRQCSSLKSIICNDNKINDEFTKKKVI